jgi:hypothetical protein
MYTFTEQPIHEDLAGGPHVTFRVTESRGDPSEAEWVDVALPLERLPTFYWAALQGGWAVDVGALIPELRELGYHLLGAVGPERRGYLLRVTEQDGLTVLRAVDPVEFLGLSLRD